jgi:hypothetical protein
MQIPMMPVSGRQQQINPEQTISNGAAAGRTIGPSFFMTQYQPLLFSGLAGELLDCFSQQYSLCSTGRSA